MASLDTHSWLQKMKLCHSAAVATMKRAVDHPVSLWLRGCGEWSWTGIECLEEKRARSTWCPCVLFVHLVVIPGVGTWWRALSSLLLAGPSCPLGSPLLQHPARRLLGGCSLGLCTAHGQLSAFFLQWFFSLLSPSPIFPVPFLPFCHNKCFILSDTIPVGFYHCVWFSPETKYCYL